VHQVMESQGLKGFSVCEESNTCSAKEDRIGKHRMAHLFFSRGFRFFFLGLSVHAWSNIAERTGIGAFRKRRYPLFYLIFLSLIFFSQLFFAWEQGVFAGSKERSANQKKHGKAKTCSRKGGFSRPLFSYTRDKQTLISFRCYISRKGM